MGRHGSFLTKSSPSHRVSLGLFSTVTMLDIKLRTGFYLSLRLHVSPWDNQNQAEELSCSIIQLSFPWRKLYLPWFAQEKHWASSICQGPVVFIRLSVSPSGAMAWCYADICKPSQCGLRNRSRSASSGAADKWPASIVKEHKMNYDD